MKRKLATLLSAACIATSFASAAGLPVTLGYSRWTNLGIGSGSNYSIDQQVDAAGNTYVLAYSYAGDYQVTTLIKFDPNGIELMRNFYTIFGYAKFLRIAPSGNIYIGGIQNSDGYDEDALIMKLSANGTPQWTRIFDEDPLKDDDVLDIWEKADGSVRMIVNGSGAHTVLVNYTKDGNKGPAPFVDTSFGPSSAMFTSDGRYAAIGKSGGVNYFKMWDANDMPAGGETVPSEPNVFTSYLLTKDASGNFYLAKNRYEFPLSKYTLTLRTISPAATVLSTIIEEGRNVEGISAADPDHVYLQFNAAGFRSVARYSLAGFQWAKDVAGMAGLCANGTEGVAVSRSTSVPTFSTFIDKYSEAGDLDWSVNATRNYVLSTMLLATPYCSKGIVHYFAHEWTSNGMFLLVDSYVTGKALKGVTVPSTSVASGAAMLGSVDLNQSDNKSFLAKLTSSNDLAFSVPSSVLVPDNLSTAGFSGHAGYVDSPTKVTVLAAGGGTNRSVTITVQPSILSSLALSPGSVKGGVNATATIKLADLTGVHGRIIDVMSSDASIATVPAKVAVKPGTSSATFTIKTTAGKMGPVTITVSSLGVTKTQTLNVTP